jgi:hypothetical protein
MLRRCACAKSSGGPFGSFHFCRKISMLRLSGIGVCLLKTWPVDAGGKHEYTFVGVNMIILGDIRKFIHE